MDTGILVMKSDAPGRTKRLTGLRSTSLGGDECQLGDGEVRVL